MSDVFMRALQPQHWAKAKGFSNGILAEGRLVFIAGQVGWDAQQRFESDDFVAQVEQALRNIVEVLAEAEGQPAHLVRLTWYILDKNDYLGRLKEVGQAYRGGLFFLLDRQRIFLHLVTDVVDIFIMMGFCISTGKVQHNGLGSFINRLRLYTFK